MVLSCARQFEHVHTGGCGGDQCLTRKAQFAQLLNMVMRDKERRKLITNAKVQRLGSCLIIRATTNTKEMTNWPPIFTTSRLRWTLLYKKHVPQNILSRQRHRWMSSLLKVIISHHLKKKPQYCAHKPPCLIRLIKGGESPFIFHTAQKWSICVL